MVGISEIAYRNPTIHISCTYTVIGHSLLFPWTALVGCSPGVYGLIGATLALLLTYRKHFHFIQHAVGMLIIVLQVTMDTVFYFLYFNDGESSTHPRSS